MKKVAKKSQYLTLAIFEKHQDFMGGQFKKVFEKFDQHSKILDRHSQTLEVLLKEIQEQAAERRDHRMMISDLNRIEVVQHRKIEGLELRIEKLEEKIK